MSAAPLVMDRYEVTKAGAGAVAEGVLAEIGQIRPLKARVEVAAVTDCGEHGAEDAWAGEATATKMTGVDQAPANVRRLKDAPDGGD